MEDKRCARCDAPLPQGYIREDGAVMAPYKDFGFYVNTWVYGCTNCNHRVR